MDQGDLVDQEGGVLNVQTLAPLGGRVPRRADAIAFPL